MSKNNPVESTLHAKDIEIAMLSNSKQEDYISLTDIARYQSDDPAAVIQNWMRNRDTIEFLGLWEELNNPNFKPLEFEEFKIAAGRNSFTLSPRKWITATNAVGLLSKSGRYGGGTFAHTDIAFEFASWVSPEFKLYIIKDYQRLKESEVHQLALDWSVKRILAKANYRVHTDAIKENLIPAELPKNQQRFVYADEADVLNVALFGMTAKTWREQNPNAKGNIRDYASIDQLLVLTNLEAMNALLIEQGKTRNERAYILNEQAIRLMTTLSNSKSSIVLNNMENQPLLPGK